MKYLVSIDSSISSCISEDSKYLYISNISDAKNAVSYFCQQFDWKYKFVDVNFENGTLDYLVNYFDSDEEEDWQEARLYLIPIEHIKLLC